jgi:hypothetical protein
LLELEYIFDEILPEDKEKEDVCLDVVAGTGTDFWAWAWAPVLVLVLVTELELALVLQSDFAVAFLLDF